MRSVAFRHRHGASKIGKRPRRERPGQVVLVSLGTSVEHGHLNRRGRRLQGRSFLAGGASCRKAFVVGMRTGEPPVDATHVEGVIAGKDPKPISLAEGLETNDTHVVGATATAAGRCWAGFPAVLDIVQTAAIARAVFYRIVHRGGFHIGNHHETPTILRMDCFIVAHTFGTDDAAAMDARLTVIFVDCGANIVALLTVRVILFRADISGGQRMFVIDNRGQVENRIDVQVAGCIAGHSRNVHLGNFVV